MFRHAWIAAFLALAGGAHAADLSKVERRIAKEPAYKTKSPRYALLVIGPEARDRVWIVKDGDTLYVDRNGDGDLTGPGEKIAANKGGSAEDGHSFEVGELNVGGKKHANLTFGVAPLKKAVFGEFAKGPEMKAALAKYPGGEVFRVSVEVSAPHLKADGRVTFTAGMFDLDGPLVMAARAADAPIVHCGGPLAVTFYWRAPALRRERTADCITTVGTPGLGTGTFAMLGYEGVIPEAAHPSLEVTYAPLKQGTPPVKRLYELKKRC